MKKYKSINQLLPSLTEFERPNKEQIEFLLECVYSGEFRARDFCYVVCSAYRYLTKEEVKDYLRKMLELKGVEYMQKTAFESHGCRAIYELEEINPNELSADVFNDQYRENKKTKYKKTDRFRTHKMKSYTNQPKASQMIESQKHRTHTRPTQTSKDVAKAAERSGKKRTRREGKEEIESFLNEREWLD